MRDAVPNAALSMLRAHWPEYLIEGWALGMFMISAGSITTLFDYPGSPVSRALQDSDVQRVLIGACMGLTAIALIYSPWGKRSGAHMNPAVTLTFLRLGHIARWDAFFYIVAQFTGGTSVCCWSGHLGEAFVQPPSAMSRQCRAHTVSRWRWSLSSSFRS